MQNQHLAEIKKIAVVGQGYVGLPLAIELAFHFSVVGFDINSNRINELKSGEDSTGEANLERLAAVQIHKFFSADSKGEEIISKDILEERSLVDSTGDSGGCRNDIGLFFSDNIKQIADAQVFIVTVPTPIDRHNLPDLSPLKMTSMMLGGVIKKGDIVVYESTVYPGCTEEECVPILAGYSGLSYNRDFFVGYSPERVNPGDKINTLKTIKKVTSGSTPEVGEKIDQLYKKIITAGTYKAASIRVAEASKAIENAQRDVNISFMNELALIFDRMGIDTTDVLEAAGTKFNFLKYRPGLVGGHCISVDPYYLTHKAIQLGYHPEVILSGRRVNNSIPSFVASKVIKLMAAKDIVTKGAKALLLGVTFKENCPDIRNTKVVDIYRELKEYGIDVDVYDSLANPAQVYREFGIRLKVGGIKPSTMSSEESKYDAVILTTAHNEFLTIDVNAIKKTRSVVFDTKSVLPRAWVDARL